MAEITYMLLRDIQQKEINSPKLSQVDGDFYKKLSTFIEQKKCEAFSSNSIMKIREYENIQKIVAAIKEKREEKILLMALRGEKINGYITTEEKELFDKVQNALSEFRKIVNENVVKQCEETHLKVKIIKDIEAYKGLDGNTYGPYKQDEIVSLPKEEVEWLIKAKMAEMVM
ncbi:MAG: hypothetical protein QXF86_03420 [Candidatus Bilamarchaeaceae archaeon]